MIVSLLGSSASVYRITEVSRSLDAINRVSVPLGRLLLQIQSDGEVFKRELERRLGQSHWQDAHWRPRPLPRWIDEVLRSEYERVKGLVRQDTSGLATSARWTQWLEGSTVRFTELMEDSDRLNAALEKKDFSHAAEIHGRLLALSDEWLGQIEWAVNEQDRMLRQAFARADSKVAALRAGLEAILVVVVSLSLLLLWLGERALRPLDELTRLARQIAQRGGLRREDKASLPEIPMSRQDEVSSLSREFHAMATALLEREKMVETQKARLQEQNRLLREMGALNENVLKSIRSILIVADAGGRITQCNPVAEKWLGVSAKEIIGSRVIGWPRLTAVLGAELTARRIEPRPLEGRVYGGSLMPLASAAGENAPGWIIDLIDISEDLELQDRLRRAENLAVIGRMSAQVAHEIRNPLHSSGLEADLAIEMAGKSGQAPLKQSLQSILASVDRLEKITENYLKLSRLSAGERKVTDLGAVLEAVLATYTSACEAQGIRVDWEREPSADLRVYGDADLLEQVLGNLLRNSMQALEGVSAPSIRWKLGMLESGRVWIRVEDNGPGVAPEVRARLFTPFLTTRAQGTGLGLSFVKKVIEEHRGEIRLIDGARGACFEILLQSLATAAAEAAPQTGVLDSIATGEASTDEYVV